ncbi:DUF551 domain-containing protein [Enterobacter asburiae]|uniref:DUF551 domain-containing protein n=1 Tax=Enterobacter asburiae TaxID=61645 RepID=UPI0020764AEB|nr:DUF551 domain-containing protein [Enterobacter asburiae]MCM7881193.1 DUF551 domain-containing protein [Enterobacter asburiae]
MSTISKERLEQLASGNAWVCVQDDEAAELARTALASLEAEPAIHRWRRVTVEPYGPYPWHYGNFIGFSKPVEGIEDEYYYPAPPAPVSVPDEDLLHMAASAIEDLLSSKDRSGAGVWADVPARLRRAAMLQGVENAESPTTLQTALELDYSQKNAESTTGINQGKSEPVTTAYKLPANTPCKEAPEHIWLQTAGVWPENGEFSELTWCSDNQHQDDTLYVRADVVSGNSPVIPDGWVACSERMPEDEQEVLTRNKMGHCFVSFFDEHSGLFFDRIDVAAACCIEHILVTHWMPLPAAPQQEVR